VRNRRQHDAAYSTIPRVQVSALFDLSDRAAPVTGGGRGLGRHIAIGLAEAGARVFVASRNMRKIAGSCRRRSSGAADADRPWAPNDASKGAVASLAIDLVSEARPHRHPLVKLPRARSLRHEA